MTPAAPRAARRWRVVERVLGLMIVAACVVVIISLLAPTTLPGSSSQTAAPRGVKDEASQPIELVKQTPTPTPHESATPTPEVTVAPPQSLPAILTLAKAGISGASITPFDAQTQLVVRNGHEELVPPTMQAVVLDSKCTTSLTSQSTCTAALYCHAYTDENPGICQHLKDVRVGDELIVENPTERLTYRAVTDPKDVPKEDAEHDPDFQREEPYLVQVITCDRDGLIDPDGHAHENKYVFFKLVHVESLVTPPPKKLDPQAADRLR